MKGDVEDASHVAIILTATSFEKSLQVLGFEGPNTNNIL